MIKSGVIQDAKSLAALSLAESYLKDFKLYT